jgi:hypothetical protein
VGGFRTGKDLGAALTGLPSGRETIAGTETCFRMELTGGIALIIWIKDKFAPQFGQTAAFSGNERPQSSHLGGLDFSIGILTRIPKGWREEKNSRLHFPNGSLDNTKNSISGNATPILFNNRQQNQSNKIVVGKLPPKSIENNKAKLSLNWPFL